MGKPIRSLLWKEWHEQRWKLAFGCVILMSLTAIGLQTRIVPDFAVVMLSVAIGSSVLPIFAVMGLVAPERAEGSLHALLALPIRPWIVLVVKTAMGFLVCAAPILGAAFVACLWAGGREETVPRMLVGCAGGILFALCALVWMLAFGIRQRGEARAALVGIAVIAVWFLTTVIYGMFFENTIGEFWIVHPFSIFEYFWDAFEHYEARQILSLVALQVAEAALLFAWAAARFSKPGRTLA